MQVYGNVLLTVIVALVVLIWQQHIISRNVNSISDPKLDHVDLRRVVICDCHGDCPDAIHVSGTVAVTNESSKMTMNSFPLAVKVVEMPIGFR